MRNISEISFPGLGIDPFELNNTAFTVFGRDVKWYGIIISIGIIAGFLYFAYRANQNGIVLDTVLDMTLVTVPIAIIGARLYFVVFYGGYDSFLDIFAIWNGGLAIYGAVIFGALAVIMMCKIKKVKFFKFADMIAPGVMLGQIIGRWGNFCNGEAFGAETDIFCRMGLCNFHTGYKTIYVHPTFLYESLWNLLGFALINIFYKKKRFNGEIFFWYVAWYGLGRTFIELLRQDSLYLGGIKISSMLGALCFAICMPLIIVMRVKSKKLAAKCGGNNTYFDMSDLLGITENYNAASAPKGGNTADVAESIEDAESCTVFDASALKDDAITEPLEADDKATGEIPTFEVSYQYRENDSEEKNTDNENAEDISEVASEENGDTSKSDQ